MEVESLRWSVVNGGERERREKGRLGRIRRGEWIIFFVLFCFCFVFCFSFFRE